MTSGGEGVKVSQVSYLLEGLLEGVCVEWEWEGDVVPVRDNFSVYRGCGGAVVWWCGVACLVMLTLVGNKFYECSVWLLMAVSSHFLAV